jgi:hypothetical protein
MKDILERRLEQATEDAREAWFNAYYDANVNEREYREKYETIHNCFNCYKQKRKKQTK